MSNTCSRANEYYINFLWASFFRPCCDWVIGLTSAGWRFPERCLVSELHLLVWWYKTNISLIVIRNSKLSHYGDKSMWTTSQSSLCWLVRFGFESAFSRLSVSCVFYVQLQLIKLKLIYLQYSLSVCSHHSMFSLSTVYLQFNITSESL